MPIGRLDTRPFRSQPNPRNLMPGGCPVPPVRPNQERMETRAVTISWFVTEVSTSRARRSAVRQGARREHSRSYVTDEA